MSNGSLGIDEKTALLIKSYELEPLPKLALEIGEGPTRDILHSGQYLGHLIRDRNMHWIGYERIINLLDRETARTIRDDPVYGFSHYIVDHGVANVFGRQIFEGKMPLEPAIGAASAIGIVEKDRQTGKTSVYTKKQLGIETQSIRDIAKKFHSGMLNEETKMSEIRDLENKDKPIKENYELAREQILRKKEEEEKIHLEEEMEPNWIKHDTDIIAIHNGMEMTPPLKDGTELGVPLWSKEPKKTHSLLTEEDEEEIFDEGQDEELPFEEPEEREYRMPFDVPKKKEDDEDDDVRLPF